MHVRKEERLKIIQATTSSLKKKKNKQQMKPKTKSQNIEHK